MAKKNLEEIISDLEHELAVKDAELHRYRFELTKANVTLEKMIEKTAEELQLAQTLQKLLSPTELPNLPGFEFSTKFLAGTKQGGDYFDLFEHVDKLKFGILISSASGYALSSLLLSVIIKISGAMEARKGLAANKVIESIVAEAQTSLQGASTGNLFYGIVDRRHFEMKYCFIGSVDGFIIRAKTGEVETLVSSGESLSKNSKIGFESHSVQLDARDKLVVLTEGFKSSINNTGQTWGSDAVRMCLAKSARKSVHELRNEILFMNQKYSGLQEPLRDQTLIIAEVKESMIKLA